MKVSCLGYIAPHPSHHTSSPSHSSTYIEVNNYQARKFIYDVTATIYGGVEPGSLSGTSLTYVLALSTVCFTIFVSESPVHAAGLHVLDPFACLSDTYWLSAHEQLLVSVYQLVHLFPLFRGVSFRTPVHLSAPVTVQFSFFFIVHMGQHLHGIVMCCNTKKNLNFYKSK